MLISIKLEAFAVDIINAAQMMIFDRVENIVERGENDVTSIFSFFHTVFKTSFENKVVRSQDFAPTSWTCPTLYHTLTSSACLTR